MAIHRWYSQAVSIQALWLIAADRKQFAIATRIASHPDSRKPKPAAAGW